MSSQLKFKKSQVRGLIACLDPHHEVVLVGDEGVYLMSFDDREHPRTIVYAAGCDPGKDEDWYGNKRRLYGGDDGADVVGTVPSISKLLNGPSKQLVATLTPDQIIMKG